MRNAGRWRQLRLSAPCWKRPGRFQQWHPNTLQKNSCKDLNVLALESLVNRCQNSPFCKFHLPMWPSIASGTTPQHSPPGGPGRLLSDAVRDWISSRRAAGRRDNYVARCDQCLAELLREHPGAGLDVVTLEVAEKWCGRGAAGNQVWRMSVLSSFCGWCVKRGWMASNPCDRLERPMIDRKPPAILTPADAKRLLEATQRTEPELLAWVVLGLFAGLRPSEAGNMTWEAIREDVAVVDGAASKVRRRRVVHLHLTAVAWLKVACALKSRLPISDKARMPRIRRLRSAMGWSAWPHDVLRHSAASYMVASTRDVAAVACELGNSPAILLTHYKALVSDADAKAFWEIMPE